MLILLLLSTRVTQSIDLFFFLLRLRIAPIYEQIIKTKKLISDSKHVFVHLGYREIHTRCIPPPPSFLVERSL